MVQKVLIICGLVIAFFTQNSFVHAADYKTKYLSEYWPVAGGEVNAQFTITLTNLRSSTYIRQYSLIIPKIFKAGEIQATINDKEVTVEKKKEKDDQRLIFSFDESTVGRGKSIQIRLKFNQANILVKRGNIWELTIPPIESIVDDESVVEFHIPEWINKKISIVKPAPIEVTQTEVVWANPGNHTIYAVFGEKQYYKLRLLYNLKNSTFSDQIQNIAIPPETAWQQVLVEKVEPEARSYFIDRDGNYMASYVVPARKNIKIEYRGFVTVLSRSQDDFRPFTKESFVKQQGANTAMRRYWELPESNKTLSFKGVRDIYNFLINNLSYDPKRVSKKSSRLGATGALKEPSHVVCTEYTDLFIALSRKNRLASREINGYGYSEGNNLRPQSLIADILHAWPEYYDSNKSQWVPVDPTWADTSKINFFDSLDLNHIVFAIHGQDSSMPKAAGMYKEKDEKDVFVSLVENIPPVKRDVKIELPIKNNIEVGHLYRTNLVLKNRGNSFIKNKGIDIKASSVTFKPSKIPVILLAPGQEMVFPVSYLTSKSKGGGKEAVAVLFDSIAYSTEMIAINSKAEVAVGTLIGVLIGFLGITILVWFNSRKR